MRRSLRTIWAWRSRWRIFEGAGCVAGVILETDDRGSALAEWPGECTVIDALRARPSVAPTERRPFNACPKIHVTRQRQRLSAVVFRTAVAVGRRRRVALFAGVEVFGFLG